MFFFYREYGATDSWRETFFNECVQFIQTEGMPLNEVFKRKKKTTAFFIAQRDIKES